MKLRLAKFAVPLSILAFFCHSSTAKPFRIAGLYSDGHLDYSVNTYGPEAVCISEAAVKQARKEGLDVFFQVIDTQWSPITTGEAAHRVVQEKFDAAVGTIGSAEALVASSILNAAHIPFITPTASHPNVTINKPYTLRVLFNDNRQAELLAEFTAKELKPKVVAVIRNISNPYSEFIGKEFANDLGGTDSPIKIYDFPIINDFNEFKELAARVLAQKPDLIFIPLWESQVAALYPELVAAKAKLTLLASDTLDGRPGFLKLLGPLSPDIPFFYSGYWNGNLVGSRADKYRKLLKTYCPTHHPTRVSVSAYDAISLILEALKKKPTLTQSQLVTQIKSMDYVGVTGRIHYEGNGDPQKPIELFRIQNNRASYWKSYE